MKIINKKKIYNGMVELRDYEVASYIKAKKPIKVVVDNEYMILTLTKLREGRIVNTQRSIFNEGQTYKLVGYKWKPEGRTTEEQLTIDMSVKRRLAEDFKKILKGGE